MLKLYGLFSWTLETDSDLVNLSDVIDSDGDLVDRFNVTCHMGVGQTILMRQHRFRSLPN